MRPWLCSCGSSKTVAGSWQTWAALKTRVSGLKAISEVSASIDNLPATKRVSSSCDTGTGHSANATSCSL